jgi:hypothetical protein
MVGFTDRQESVVSNWRKNVVTKLGEEMFLLFDQPSTLIGSYDRDTITKYLSEGDVDVMVVLHYGDNKNWENKEALQRRCTGLKRYYKMLILRLNAAVSATRERFFNSLAATRIRRSAKRCHARIIRLSVRGWFALSGRLFRLLKPYWQAIVVEILEFSVAEPQNYFLSFS